MKHDRNVGFINHSCSSSARDIVAETAPMDRQYCTESLQLQLSVIFMFLPESNLLFDLQGFTGKNRFHPLRTAVKYSSQIENNTPLLQIKTLMQAKYSAS